SSLLQDGQGEIVLRDEQTALRGSLRSDQLEVTVELRHGEVSVEGSLEGGGDACDVVARFVSEFQTEVAHACADPLFEMSARFLRLGSEHRVPAAHIRHNGMSAACIVAQGELVLLTRTAEVPISR